MSEEKKQENTTEKEPSTPKEKKKKGKFKIFLLLILFVLCGGLAGGYYFFGDMLMSNFFGRKASSQQQAKKKDVVIGPILSLDPFLFNIAGSVSKFAKVSISIELKDAKILEEAKKMTPVLRDRALTVLSAKGPEELMDEGSREKMKQEIRDTVKDIFKSGGDVSAIYITDIIIQ